jgi:hypothetical protein
VCFLHSPHAEGDIGIPLVLEDIRRLRIAGSGLDEQGRQVSREGMIEDRLAARLEVEESDQDRV